MDDFEICSEVNSLLESNQELKAREILIKLLDQLHRDGRDYSSLGRVENQRELITPAAR